MGEYERKARRAKEKIEYFYKYAEKIGGRGLVE
jgi:hypothetical protein